MRINTQFLLKAHNRASTETPIPGFGVAISGRRYYNPSQGRFVGRDPIEEQGGINLYGYCGNNGVNRWDYLGMNGLPTISFGAGYVAPDPGPFVGPVAQQQTTLTIVGPALGGGPSAGLVGPVAQQFRAWDSNDPNNLTGSEYWSQDDWRPFMAWQNEQSLSTVFENPGFPLAGSTGFDRLIALDLWSQQMQQMALSLYNSPGSGTDAAVVAAGAFNPNGQRIPVVDGSGKTVGTLTIGLLSQYRDSQGRLGMQIAIAFTDYGTGTRSQNWVQTIWTNSPQGEVNGVPRTSPYVDSTTASPLYGNNSEVIAAGNGSYAAGFGDTPARYSGSNTISWRAELSLVGTNSSGTVVPIQTVQYSFSIPPNATSHTSVRVTPPVPTAPTNTHLNNIKSANPFN